MVFSLEFKNGKKAFEAQDAQQAEDYAIDIKNFHKESENLYVCPILIATKAKPYPKEQSIDCYSDGQIFLQRENIETLMPKLTKIANKYGTDEQINFETWYNSPYHPTPTIIAAAVEAYRSHNLSEIANSKAGQNDIDLCESKIEEICTYARDNNKKCICFVTGVPGAGKTLVGLDIVSKNLGKGDNTISAYISGNYPLVQVLRAALEKSVRQEKKLTRETKVAIETLIQASFAFKKDNISRQTPPPEKILIFDEAQRVWNRQQMIRKHKDLKYDMSEPELIYRVMDKHNDWAVIICLVGLGQDIHDGEVGINEWFKCGINGHEKWEMYYSPEILKISNQNIDIDSINQCNRCIECNGLHLGVPVRTFKSELQSKFVDAILENRIKDAVKLYPEVIDNYPIYITRDANKAKEWTKKQVRGSQRCGVLASSGALRLKPEGIYVPKDMDVVNWFLAPSDDIRSSNMMEIVASEFKVQGLEIDWATVCWDADLRRHQSGEEWEFYKFRGNKWEKRKDIEQQKYLINSYRVLMTRARQGMVIFVPRGVNKNEDPTRDSDYYDRIYGYLVKCGINELP